MELFELEIIPEVRDWLAEWTDDDGRFAGAVEELLPVRMTESGEVFPLVDLGETDSSYFLKAELPGFDRKNLEVLYEDGILTIRGRREPENHGTRHLLTERFYGEFERHFELPEEVDPKKVKAQYRDGILTVRIPKNKSKVKEIPVQGR